jgi:hypothetical protein
MIVWIRSVAYKMEDRSDHFSDLYLVSKHGATLVGKISVYKIEYQIAYKKGGIYG